MEGYWRAKFQNKITNNLSVQNVIQIACKHNSDGCFLTKNGLPSYSTILLSGQSF